jgi:type IV secretion system protein VirB2
MNRLNSFKTRVGMSLFSRIVVVTLALITSPAYAQFEKPTAKLLTVQAALIGVGITIVTCAVLWASYKMIFQHAKFAEMTHIFWGGALAGSATAIAGWLMG